MAFTTHPFLRPEGDDTLHEECGVFGVYGHVDASALTALGLHALQHRGQEACGIVAFDGAHFNAHRAIGLVGDNFDSPNVVDALAGHAAIGHNRYSTTGETLLRNVQPLFADFDFGGFAIGHNGNLTNSYQLRRQLVRRGSIFQSTTDTEVIVHLMATSRGGNVIDRLVEALRQVEGAYSVIALAEDMVIGCRDPLGVRPLVLGSLVQNDGSVAHILASETCALDIIGADYVRDLEPGEMIVCDKTGITSHKPFLKTTSRFCVFEYIYFARPDSIVEGTSVYEARQSIGRELAREAAVDADVVIPVPDSGVPAALGYAKESGISFDLGIIRNHYVGRTFIEPTDNIRNLGVRLKHNANRAKIKGQRVILVDDSIVRGTTSKKIVQMVRQAGAAEVHMRVSSPPTSNPCFYGIDTPAQEQLMAHNYSVEEMARIIGVDSLAFITIDGLYRAMGQKARDAAAPRYCDACFTGAYPTALPDRDEASRQPELSLLAERRAG